MRDKIRVGIIGTGQIANMHMQRYAKMPDVEMVEFCDIDLEKAQKAADAYHVSNVTPDYHELLKREDIDSVDVCVHNFLHAPITVDALRAGKNVYCEKPMAWTYSDAKWMYDTAQETGKMLAVQLSTIFEPETRGAKKLMEDGLLGSLYYAKCYTFRRRGRPFVDGYGAKEFVNTNTSGGGTVLDMAVYSLGRMMYLLDAPEVHTVSGATYQQTGMYEDKRQESQYNVEEMGVAFIRLAGGMSLFLESSWAMHAGEPEGDYIMGSRGGVRLDPLTYFTTLGDMEMDGTFDLKQADWRWHQHDPLLEAYDDPQKHWIWAQLGRVPLLNSAYYALRTAQIQTGLFLSAQKGREVTIAEIEAVPGKNAR